MIGQTYVDVMDDTRHVRPVKDEGKQYLCEVFWLSEGRTVYGGKTLIGKRLFEQSSHVGFVPWTPPPLEIANATSEET